MPRGKGPGRALAVNAQSPSCPFDNVRFDFRDIVAHVIEQPKLQLSRRKPKLFFPGGPCQMHKDLPVGKGEVGGGGHGGDVLPGKGGRKPRACELSVGKLKPFLVHALHHPSEEFVANQIGRAHV